jgi:hypothetical protein
MNASPHSGNNMRRLQPFLQLATRAAYLTEVEPRTASLVARHGAGLASASWRYAGHLGKTTCHHAATTPTRPQRPQFTSIQQRLIKAIALSNVALTQRTCAISIRLTHGGCWFMLAVPQPQLQQQPLDRCPTPATPTSTCHPANTCHPCKHLQPAPTPAIPTNACHPASTHSYPCGRVARAAAGVHHWMAPYQVSHSCSCVGQLYVGQRLSCNACLINYRLSLGGPPPAASPCLP